MRSVERTPELERIAALPRRVPEASDELVDEMTELLRTPQGTMRLFPLQALALLEMMTQGGAFLPLDVGEGKTLISLLAAYVLDAKRPLLLLPASLIGKTGIDRDELARDWLIPTNLCLMSFTMLGLVQASAWLEQYAPDVIVVDESQKLKDRDVAVTRRVERYMHKHPETRFVAMTGTITGKSIYDFAHYLRWSLKGNAPVPATQHELDTWANALDETLADEFERREPGALLELATEAEKTKHPPMVAARLGFQRRLRETPGVVSSASSGTRVDIPLRIRPLRYEMSATTSAHFKRLRNDKVTPDGWDLWEKADVWRHARELAIGFHQVWDPRPPDAWKAARRAWFAFVREVLSRSRSLDSPEHVAQACEAGKLPRDLLDAWRAVETTYEINAVPIWHDDGAIKVAAAWTREPGIVWVEHVPFGERLAAETGLKYYGAKGFAADGEFINHADPRRAVVASVKANREGRNLQKKWSRNLVTCPSERGDLWQQLLGRTHRPGQTASAVTFDVFLGCAEHVRAWTKALASARYIRDMTGIEQKLLLADKTAWPSDIELASWSGPRWE